MSLRVRAATDLGWLVQLTEAVLTHNARGVEAIDSSDRIVGQVIFDHWTPNSCRAHVAVAYPLVGRVLIGPAFSYVFEQADRKLIIAEVPGHNAASLRITSKLGFRVMAKIPNGWGDGVDLVFFTMRREECPWLIRARRVA